MKNLRMIALVAATFFVANVVMAQAIISNSTSKVVVLKSADKTSEALPINPHKSGNVSFAPVNGDFTFELYAYSGMDEKAVGKRTITIKNGRGIISDDVISGTNKIAKSTANQSNLGITPVKHTPSTQNQINKKMTRVAVVDSTKHKIWFLNTELAGLALAPGKSSMDSIYLPLGQIEATVKLDVKEDKESDGRNYREAVFSTIVVEGQKTLVIKNENITRIGGSQIETKCLSLIPYKIVFTAGPFVGQALKFKSMTRKGSLAEGFNSFAIQYVGSDGLKYQADIEVIVTKYDKPLKFLESDVKNARVMIKQ